MSREREELARQAAQVRALHRPGNPLLLPNAWDAASARLVAGAGFPVIATSSGAVADSLGYEDDNSMPAQEAFAAVSRISANVSLPVTADMEAGYGLSPEDFVDRLLAAGAVGCNLEDTDHRGSGLVDAEGHAARLGAVKAAAKKAGVDIVLNARVDVPLRGKPAPDLIAEAIRRARLYRAAGADCVYPIFLDDEKAIANFVEAVDSPVNILLLKGDLGDVARIGGLGAARVSMGSGLRSVADEAVKTALARLRLAN
ncbi:MAG TPA: isocitrate lyase/phosphoenolpyruvate mutase family protein [Candidatus Dormibacteraeota bacterium]